MVSIPLSEIMETLHIVSLKLEVPFRNITTREIALWEGPSGWAEFPPFLEYTPTQCVPWFQSALEASHGPLFKAEHDFIPVNGTIPAISATEVPDVIKLFPGVKAFKIKVAQRGQTLHDDLARIRAVERAVPEAAIRLDANGGWNYDEANFAIDKLTPFNIEYLEQPVSSLAELQQLTRTSAIPLAADESIRLADDAKKVIAENVADVLILKVAPLGGVQKVKELAQTTDKKIVISSALESSIGMHRGALAAASICPEIPCGLGTVALLKHDICNQPLLADEGYISTTARTPDPVLLTKFSASPQRRNWWKQRIEAVHAIIDT
ncbi:MAG: o-succinylbenzoate synthase [Micrococcaceae bacterium]